MGENNEIFQRGKERKVFEIFFNGGWVMNFFTFERF